MHCLDYFAESTRDISGPEGASKASVRIISTSNGCVTGFCVRRGKSRPAILTGKGGRMVDGVGGGSNDSRMDDAGCGFFDPCKGSPLAQPGRLSFRGLNGKGVEVACVKRCLSIRPLSPATGVGSPTMFHITD